MPKGLGFGGGEDWRGRKEGVLVKRRGAMDVLRI